MIVSVNSKIWNRIYYNIRDSLLEDLPLDDDRRTYSNILWLEGKFAEMGIKLFNDGSGDQRVWTHVDISDEIDMVELMLRWG